MGEMSAPELMHDVGTRMAVNPGRAAPSRDEQRVARGLVGGDPEALRALHERFAGVVFGYLLSTLGNRATAEDVCQQVFTEVWTRGSSYDAERASLLTWVMTITRSRAIDELRRRRPEPHAPESAAALADAAEPGSASAGVPDDIDGLLARWEMAHLLDRVDQDDALLLRLRFYAELSQTEIADRTGLPLGTVKTRMVRGLERMRDLMAADEPRIAGPGVARRTSLEVAS
ncbi:RNA polymerase sigma factor [Paraconexibacter sp. AEG42_29]|uniref:RNA polymerase sigma factor n=1 Tax=Paraconexibacter sp. AEG42_29 TaxID=2997339 RepID=A0AAU7ARN0_9ACTN